MQSTTSRLSSAFSSAAEKFSNCGKLVLVIYVCFGILYIAASPSVLIKSHGIPSNSNNNNMKKQIRDENKHKAEQKIILNHKSESNLFNILKPHDDYVDQYEPAKKQIRYHASDNSDLPSTIRKQLFEIKESKENPNLISKKLKTLSKIVPSVSSFHEYSLPGERDEHLEELTKQNEFRNQKVRQNVPRRDESSEGLRHEIVNSAFLSSSSGSSHDPKFIAFSSEDKHQSLTSPPPLMVPHVDIIHRKRRHSRGKENSKTQYDSIVKRSSNVSESVANVASETKPLFKKLLKIENGTSTSQERSHINDLNEIFKIKIVEVPRFGKKVHPAKVLKNTSKYAVLLEFSIEEYLDRYNKRGIKPFQEINETERLNITKAISTTKRKLSKNERKKIPYQLQSTEHHLMKINESRNKINKNRMYNRETRKMNTKTGTNENNFFILELRAARGMFNLKHKNLFQPATTTNCSSSRGQENCFYEYKHGIRSSVFNLKSNYVHINLFHSKKAGQENEDDSKNTRMNGKRLETTITSFFQFPVPQCSTNNTSNIGINTNESSISNSENCSTSRFTLLSVNVTASYNESRLDDVIFVISVNVKSFDENENLSLNQKTNDYNNNDVEKRTHVEGDIGDENTKSYSKEQIRIVRNSSDIESIALLEYICCGDNIAINNNKNLFGGSKEDSNDNVRSNSNIKSASPNLIKEEYITLHSIKKVSGNYPTSFHPQKLQPLFHRPSNNTNHEDAVQENETKKSSANERLDKEHVLQRNIRLVSPDNSQSTSNLHQKILFSLHHQQSSEHHHHRTESSFLWSANKTLLHAIRLQVINECLYKIPVLTLPLLQQIKWSYSSPKISFSPDFSLTSFSLSSSSPTHSTRFSNSFRFWETSRKNTTKEYATTSTTYRGSLSLHQLWRLNSDRLYSENMSNNSYNSSNFNQDFKDMDSSDGLQINANNESLKLNESNPISIHIYLRIPKTMRLGTRKINWLWMNAMPKVGEETYSSFINDSSMKKQLVNKKTVLRLKMSQRDSLRKSNNNKSTKIKTLGGIKFLQYLYDSYDNANYSWTKNISNFRGTNVTFKHKEKETIPSYAYLKLAILSAKNLSALNLQGVKKSIKLELTFFQSEIFNTSCKEAADSSSFKSSTTVQKCIHKLLQVVYVMSNNPNSSSSRQSFIQDSLKAAKRLSYSRNSAKELENHKMDDGSNEEVLPLLFQAKLKKFLEFISSKVIHYPSKSKAISTPNIPLFKIANNDSSNSLNKESALRTNYSHQSSSDLKENVETHVSSNSLQPSSMSSSIVDTRKNTLKEMWQNKRKKFNSISKLQSKIGLKFDNRKNNYGMAWNRIKCKHWLDIIPSSTMAKVTYDSNIDPEYHANGDVNSNKQQGETTITNHNVYNGDNEFNKAGIKIILPKTHKGSLNSSVQLYCAAQIRLPHGYWPNIKLTVIQGYDAQNTSFAPVTSSDNDVPHSSIHTKPSSSSCSFQLRGYSRYHFGSQSGKSEEPGNRVLSNILYIQDLLNKKKKMFREKETPEKSMHTKKKSSSCGATSTDDFSNVTRNYEKKLLSKRSKHYSFKMSHYEFNLTSNIALISARNFFDLQNRTDDNNIMYQISINAIKHNIVKRSVQSNEGSDINLCGDLSATNKWIKINSRQDNNDASFQQTSTIKSTKDSTKCVRLLKSSNKKNPPLSWYQANKSCIDLGGRLVIIQSEIEDLELQSLISNSDDWNPKLGVWIGAISNKQKQYKDIDFDIFSSSKKSKAFRWIDGSQLGYSNWFRGWKKKKSSEISNKQDTRAQSQLEIDAIKDSSYGQGMENISNDTYCVEMRAAFKGIELNANSNDVERIRKTFEHRRKGKTSSFSNGILNLVKQTRFARSPEEQKKLHWTIKPCNVPSNNWYICEKYVHQYHPQDHLSENNDSHYPNGNIDGAYMADDPKESSSFKDEDEKCNRKIVIKDSIIQNEREFDVSSTSMGAPFSAATNCTVEITSLLKGSITTIEFKSILLDGGTPSMEPEICNKRREYLVISQFYMRSNSDDMNEEYSKPIKQRMYCGNWSKSTEPKHLQNETNNFLPKSVHYIGDVKNSNIDNIGFRILYVVRSAMPPVINDGKRQEQQNGFKVKVYASSELERRPTTKYINVNSLRKSKIGKFVLTKGKVSSPGYPFNYPGGVSQTIIITSPKKTNIVLNFQSISIEGEVTNSQSTDKSLFSHSCKYDKLEFAEQLDDVDKASLLVKDKSSWKVTNTVCDNYPNSSTLNQGTDSDITTTVYSYKTGSNNLRITFASDLSVSSTGFLATWKVVRRNDLVSDLGVENFFKNDTGVFCKNKSLEENTGWIENMGFNVEENVEAIKFERDSPVDCWFSIVAPVDHRIVLSIQQSRFNLVNNANEIISQGNYGSQSFYDQHRNRQKRNNNPTNFKRIDRCAIESKAKDFAFVEVYLSPTTNLKYTMKFCFPGENYGLDNLSSDHGGGQFWTPYKSRENKIHLKSSSSTFIENETINKGYHVPYSNFERSTEKVRSKLGNPLELFSSGTHVLVRFYSSDGRFPSKGFRAKYKTENVQFEHLGLPMTLQPSHRDYFSYREGQGYEKPFNPDKSSFERGLSSNWPYTINSPLPNYNLNPSVPSHLSFMKTYPVNLYGGHQSSSYHSDQKFMSNVNHPLIAPQSLKYRHIITAPSGYMIKIAIPSEHAGHKCQNTSYLEIEDPYLNPPKVWRFCRPPVNLKDEKFQDTQYGNTQSNRILSSIKTQYPGNDLTNEPVVLQSFLNIFNVRQITLGTNRESILFFNIPVKAEVDPDVPQKIQQIIASNTQTSSEDGINGAVSINNENETSNAVAATSPTGSIKRRCDSNLCLYGGICDPVTQKCKCKPPYIGPYCAQTQCDAQPCENGGICKLTQTDFVCVCPDKRFGGKRCHQRLNPCDDLFKPCSGNGICHQDEKSKETRLGYRCQCHLWWSGEKCNRKIHNIPYKPLSERMLEEPFWLGLIAVTVVMSIIGICYLFKKHLPDKFDKILNTGTDLTKNANAEGQIGGHNQASHQDSSHESGGMLSQMGSTFFGEENVSHSLLPPGAHAPADSSSPSLMARSLLGKLAIRKPSILSITSNLSSPGGNGSGGENKNGHFGGSLEDVEKGSPSKRRPSTCLSPSHEEERRRILKMLVTPQANKRTQSSASFDSMVMKAARSAENVSKDEKDAGNSNNNKQNKIVRNVKTDTKSNALIIRKQSSQSLQIPERVPLRRSISDTETRILQGSPKQEEGNHKSKSSSTVSVTTLLSPIDPRDNKKVTFSQVVDQMACSLSDSSSMSDLSSCAAEDFKHNVNANSSQIVAPTRSSRTGRKLFRSRRKHSHGGGGGSQSLAPAGSNQLSAYFPRHRRKWGSVGGNQQDAGASSVSGSESNVFDTSMESLESHNSTVLMLRPLSSLNPSTTNGSCVAGVQQSNTNDGANSRAGGGSKLQKLSSADSLFSMIRNLASTNRNTSTPSSPQFSDINDIISSGFPTPLTTPDTPTGKKSGLIYSPRPKDGNVKKKRESVPSSGSSSPASSPIRNQIMVEVVDPFNPRKDSLDHPHPEPDSLAGSTTSLSSASSSQPTITLEVPGFAFGKCLSPIKELPSPMPTPLMSPVPYHHRVSVSSLGSHSSSPLGDDSNFPGGICSSCGGCGRSPNKGVIAIVRSTSPGNPGLSPSSTSSSSSEGTSNSSSRSRALRKSYKNSKVARASLEKNSDPIEGGYSPGASESIEMDEIIPAITIQADEGTLLSSHQNFEDSTTIEIPTKDFESLLESVGEIPVSPNRRSSYQETRFVVPVAVVQRRPSLVATMDAERQETLRRQSLCNSIKKEPSIPVITVTCDDSEEEEEDEVTEYGFIPLEEQNTNSIQEDSLEQNNTELDISIVEGIEDIPSVNIIPPSLPQSPQKGDQTITDTISECCENEIQVNEKEEFDESNSTTISSSSGDPSVLDGVENAVEDADPSIQTSNPTNPCTFVLNKSSIQSARKMEAIVVEIPLSTTIPIASDVSPSSGDTNFSSYDTSSSTTSPTSVKIAENSISPNLPKSSSSKRKRPPPLKIPNSNFLNFGPSPQETKNVTTDTTSRPCSHNKKDIIPSNALMTSKELGERRSQTPTLASSVETKVSPSNAIGPENTMAEQFCSVFSENDQTTIMTEKVVSITSRRRQSLVKQQGIMEDITETLEVETNDENVSDINGRPEQKAISSPSPISPKFLHSDGKFDSTPRERSQSVQYSEPSIILSSNSGYKHRMSNSMKVKGGKKIDLKSENYNKPGKIMIPNNQIISLMIQPPTPCGSNLPEDFEGDLSKSSKIGYSGKMEGQQTIQNDQDVSVECVDFPSTHYSWTGVTLGSPPPLRKQSQSSCIKEQTNKPKSLDITSGLGPSITVTPMSELESDADSSPNLKDSRSMSCFAGNVSPIGNVNTGSHEYRMTNPNPGMQYLSPYTIAVPISASCSGNSRTTSDSNLSSSGYSSMASPGPSRSGSFNPICASESEDASSGTPTKITCSMGSGPACFHHHFPHHAQLRSSSSRSSGYANSMIHTSDTGLNAESGIINPPHSPPMILTQQQHGMGSSMFIRRPSPLLKSPSFDSESSDPLNPSSSNSCYMGQEHCQYGRLGATHQQRLINVPQIGQHSSSEKSYKQSILASAFRYRTDSETTDDQCIPESLSEEPGHDSALDTTEEIDEEEVEDEEEEEDLMDASPNIDGPKVPQLCLSEAAQSSTESEKTVILESQISLATRDKKDLSADNISSLMTDQTISSENIHLESQSLKSSMLSLPEIVIQPGTPSASSPSAPSSPTSATPSSMSTVSIVTATELVAKSMKSQSSAIVCSTVSDTFATQSSSSIEVKSTNVNLPFVKANSIPPQMSSMLPNSSLEYEQLETAVTNNTSSNTATTSTAASCCSSRSESPLSDRGVVKCSSLISLHLRNIETDGNSLGSQMFHTSCTSDTALDADNFIIKEGVSQDKMKSERKVNASLKEEDARKKIVSPSSKKPRRKKRSGTKDYLSSSSLRLCSPAGSDHKDESKLKETSPNESIASNSKQALPGISQNLSTTSGDGSTPRKSQIRRRIRSQSKLSDLVTSSSNESLLSNNSSQKCESISSLRRHHHPLKHESSSSSNEELDECFSQSLIHKTSNRRQQYSSLPTGKIVKCSHSPIISCSTQPEQCPHCLGNFVPIKTSSSSIPLPSSSTAAGSAVVLQSVSSSSSNLSTSKVKHGSLVGSTSSCNIHYAKSQSKSIKVVPRDRNTATNLPISSPILPSSSSQSVAKGTMKVQDKKLSNTPGKQKRKRTKLHGDKYVSKLQVQQKHPSPLAISNSYIAPDSGLSGAQIPSSSMAGTSTSTSDSCSGEGRKASTSSSSTGSCTNLTSQLETTSFLLTDSTTANVSKASTAPETLDKMHRVLGEENPKPSKTSYCSATEDDVSTIM